MYYNTSNNTHTLYYSILLTISLIINIIYARVCMM